MRNFQIIASGLDVMPLAHAVQRHAELWNQHTFRTTYTNTPHIDVDDIWLRYSAPNSVENPQDTTKVVNDSSAVWYPAATLLPQYKPIVLDLMRRVEAYSLERLLITRIRPGGKILRHADANGTYVQLDNIARYHVVLQGLPGSMFGCGNESVNMRTGEVWWFDAHTEHEVANNSADDRIHLLVDLRTMP